MKTGIVPYERLGDFAKNCGKVRNKISFKDIFSRRNLILLPVAFFLGRASLAGGVMPFGLPFYAATMGTNVNHFLIVLSIALGLLSIGEIEQVYITVAAILLFNAFNLLFKNYRARLNFRYAVVSFASILIPEFLMIYIQGFLLYDLFKGLLNSFIAFAMVFIFRNAVPVITDPSRKYRFSGEETISIAISMALVLSGFTNVQLLGFSIKNILCILVVILFSYKCGAGVGAATGVTVGLLVSMSSAVTPLIIASYGFCGLLSGVLGNLGKIGSCLGFVMGNAMLTLYLTGSTEVLIYLKEVVAAVVLFILTPPKAVEAVVGVFGKNTEAYPEKRGYSIRIKEITVERLNKFSRAFKELAKTFNEISETKVVADKEDVSVLFDRVAEKVCKDCSLCLYCWERNFYDTYQIMFKIIEKLDAKGRIENTDIPEYFLERCGRIYDFVDAVNNVYELFKVDMVWKSKIGESRGLVSQQLDGLSRIISNLASEIDMNLHFKSDVEDILLSEMCKAGIKAEEVVVFENKWGKYEISVFHKGCGGKRNCITTIAKLVSDITGRKMVKDSPECFYSPRTQSCSLKLTEEEALKVTTGIARMPKLQEADSGDNYTFMNTGDGKYIIALSDGMGSGQKAAIQSRATINLLEQFMESGFDRDTTVKLINSILVLKSNEDSFATIDMSVIDLYSGEVEFVKVGAVPTYIKREDRVEAVKLASLPAGILSNIETELIHKKLENGNFIIMMSDGIADLFKPEEQKDMPLADFIRQIESINPQDVADRILEEACRRCGGKPADDMMVIAAKIWKKAG
ncbi:MAG: stage II sporulation protein E [Clostridiales bacterium]|jgi:stage II sporulation protein E|nr:stage II sporulation protein E [Eubacteriales bacterium]MDH7567137.1 stage II sporulation protein E [Clostridiales bacterium]